MVIEITTLPSTVYLSTTTLGYTGRRLSQRKISQREVILEKAVRKGGVLEETILQERVNWPTDTAYVWWPRCRTRCPTHDCKRLRTFTLSRAVCMPGFNKLRKTVRQPIHSPPNLSIAARSHAGLPITSHLYQDWAIPVLSSGIHTSSKLSTKAGIHCGASPAYYSVAQVDQLTDSCPSKPLRRSLPSTRLHFQSIYCLRAVFYLRLRYISTDTMWKPDDPSEGSWALWMNNSCQRYLMREVWQNADNTIFVSIDCEHSNTRICELGLTIQKKNEEPICRNIVVNNSFGNKAYPRPFGFGDSEYVTKSSDLFPILDDICNEAQSKKQKMVLVGFDVSNDLKYLNKDAGWRPQKETVVLDVQDICKTFLLKNKGFKLEDGLRKLNIQIDEEVPLHIGGNDSWYIMRLLFDMAQRDSTPKAAADANFSSHTVLKKSERSSDMKAKSIEVSQNKLCSLVCLALVLNASMGS